MRLLTNGFPVKIAADLKYFIIILRCGDWIDDDTKK